MRTPAGPWTVTGFAACQLLLLVPTVVAFVLVGVGGLLALVTVGVPILVLGLPALRWIAERHRSMAARTLGHEVPAGYLPTSGLGTLARVRTWAVDPMTWRDLLWVLVSLTAGFALALLTVLLLLLVVTGAIWWYGAPHVMRLRATLDRTFLTRGHTEQLEQRVVDLTVSRADTVDHNAAELRRIERDLHDGAQARLVAVGMTLGLADDLFERDPEAALRLVAEARDTTGAALADLRAVVRGIHPPVLADRGLAGAVEALALDMALPVTVLSDLEGRPPEPVESAVYFAVAECLANVGKHAGASRAWVDLRHDSGVLRASVGDDGRGGADARHGTGMLGIMRRLSAFDGTMVVSSPDRGPTLITLEIPCALSSPRTTLSSATD
ncbi:sensor histidine kinase [Nocardioides sp. zg-1308]|uniref:sensor histidine kinase n=1 Tax=Nocardioides sp. zg-1308 TaxID=2736253 RepID=UPI001554441D|nr:sensor histidine kinase [Nocardioides sp. zg-1308]NPD06702.1 sensor histidine kinase [Nocardioides sp. zg-1308]